MQSEFLYTHAQMSYFLATYLEPLSRNGNGIDCSIPSKRIVSHVKSGEFFVLGICNTAIWWHRWVDFPQGCEACREHPWTRALSLAIFRRLRGVCTIFNEYPLRWLSSIIYANPTAPHITVRQDELEGRECYGSKGRAIDCE